MDYIVQRCRLEAIAFKEGTEADRGSNPGSRHYG